MFLGKKLLPLLRNLRLYAQIVVGMIIILAKWKSLGSQVGMILFDFPANVTRTTGLLDEIGSAILSKQVPPGMFFLIEQNPSVWLPRRDKNLILIGQPESFMRAGQLVKFLSAILHRETQSDKKSVQVKLIADMGTITSTPLRRRIRRMSGFFEVQIIYSAENIFPVTRQQAARWNPKYSWLTETTFAQHFVWTEEFSRALREINPSLRTRVCGPILITKRTTDDQGSPPMESGSLNIAFFDVPALNNLETWSPYHWEKGVAILSLITEALDALKKELPIKLYYKSKRGLDGRHASEYLRAVDSFAKHSSVIPVDPRMNVRFLVQRTHGTFSTLGTSTALVARHFGKPSKYLYADNSDVIQFFVDYGIGVARTSDEVSRILVELNNGVNLRGQN